MIRRRQDAAEGPVEAESASGGIATLEQASEPEPTSARKPRTNWLTAILQFEITQAHVKRKDLMHFSRQLAVFVRAGIPLLQAIDDITEEMGSKRLKAVLLDMRERIAGGDTLSGAAAMHPEAFPAFYLGMLRTAELSGTLDTVLDRLAEYVERDIEARRKITSALTYPAIIAFVAVVVVVILVSFVLPRFRTFFEELHANLPLPTRILLRFSHITTTYWYAFVAGAALIVGAFVWMQGTVRGRTVRDTLLLKIPAVSDLVRHVLLERFCRIMSAMMSSGVPLPESMRVVADATPNVVFKAGLENAREEMMRGSGLAQPLAATGLFPASARQMMRVGEDTGTLDKQLETAAIYFDRELDYKIKRFTSLFEPTVIILMGCVVGFVAVALVSAMYGIFHQVHP